MGSEKDRHHKDSVRGGGAPCVGIGGAPIGGIGGAP